MNCQSWRVNGFHSFCAAVTRSIDWCILLYLVPLEISFPLVLFCANSWPKSSSKTSINGLCHEKLFGWHEIQGNMVNKNSLVVMEKNVHSIT